MTLIASSSEVGVMMPVAMVIDMVRHALLVVGNEGEAETSPYWLYTGLRGVCRGQFDGVGRVQDAVAPIMRLHVRLSLPP